MNSWDGVHIGLGLFAAVVCFAHCAETPAMVQAQTDVAAWTADDGLCVKSGDTRAAIDACRDAMRRYFCSPDGGVLFDAGACQNVTLSNGERP